MIFSARPAMTFSKTKHQGSNELFMCVVKGGKLGAGCTTPFGYLFHGRSGGEVRLSAATFSEPSTGHGLTGEASHVRDHDRRQPA